MAVKVTKSQRGDGDTWHYLHVDERGSALASSIDEGGFPTLADLLDAVKERFPDEAIEGIGGDEPEAVGLSW